ncbi:MAG: energy-coupling factor transporter transmembrane protein EcfT [Oscillospiraceae bacterium]
MSLKTLDPRVKLLMLIGLSGTAVFSRSLWELIALLLLTVLTLLAGGVALGRLWGQSRRMFGLIALIFVLQCVFTRRGEPLISAFGFVFVTVSGAKAGGVVVLRLLIILFSALIVLTGEARDYLLAMTQSHVPYELAFMVMIAMRFIPALREEASDVLCAAQMRGTRIKDAPIQKKLRTYVMLALPITAGAIRRSDQTAIAMEARAFRLMPKRTSMRRLRFKTADIVYLAAYFTVLAAIIAFS